MLKSERLRRIVGDEPARRLWRVSWKKLGYLYSGVYCITTDERRPTKIGVSHEVVTRLASLQTNCWKTLDISEYFYCLSSEIAHLIERKVHEILQGDGIRLQGEWFDIDPEKAAEVVRFAAACLNVELRTDAPDDRIKAAIDAGMLDFLKLPSSEWYKPRSKYYKLSYAQRIPRVTTRIG